MPIPRTQVNKLADYPGSFFAPPLALLPPAEVAEDGQDQGHDAQKVKSPKEVLAPPASPMMPAKKKASTETKGKASAKAPPIKTTGPPTTSMCIRLIIMVAM